MSSDFVPKFKCDFLLQQSIKSLVNIVYCNIVYFKCNIVCLLSFTCYKATSKLLRVSEQHSGN